jgi:hypothetical protein
MRFRIQQECFDSTTLICAHADERVALYVTDDFGRLFVESDGSVHEADDEGVQVLATVFPARALQVVARVRKRHPRLPRQWPN